MCFTPLVSLTIGFVELLLAGVLFFRYKRTTLRDFSVALIVLLGLYQFSEFMLCTYAYSILFAKIGIIIYTLLPAVHLHALLKVYKRETNYFWIYVWPISAVLLMVLHPSFVQSASCDRMFVSISTIFADWEGIVPIVLYFGYLTYYFGFMLYGFSLIVTNYIHQKDVFKRKFDICLLFGGAFMLIPTLLFTTILPSLRIKFPSVLCTFAIFVAIAYFLAASSESEK